MVRFRRPNNTASCSCLHCDTIWEYSTVCDGVTTALAAVAQEWSIPWLFAANRGFLRCLRPCFAIWWNQRAVNRLVDVMCPCYWKLKWNYIYIMDWWTKSKTIEGVGRCAVMIQLDYNIRTRIRLLATTTITIMSKCAFTITIRWTGSILFAQLHIAKIEWYRCTELRYSHILALHWIVHIL